MIKSNNMKSKISDPHSYLNLIGAIILLVGIGSAILIYQSVDDDSISVLGYVVGGGSVYSIKPENSKIYLHDLELYGGKAGVLADEFRRWFIGLWQGKTLAFTIAFITVFISFGIFFVARHLPSPLESDVHSESNRHESTIE